MAYAFTASVAKYRIASRLYYLYTIIETGITAGTDEFTIENLPFRGTILQHKSVLAAGTGNATTVDPELGEATTTKEVFENGAAGAAPVNMNLAKGYSATKLFGRSQANGTVSGANGKVTTTITIVEGAL